MGDCRYLRPKSSGGRGLTARAGVVRYGTRNEGQALRTSPLTSPMWPTDRIGLTDIGFAVRQRVELCRTA